MPNLTPYQRAYLRFKMRLSVRTFFESSGYIEVDTPILVVSPGTETYLRYFETAWFDHRQKPIRRYLRSSPEIHMKQLLSESLPKIFQIAPCFRNYGEFSDWHHPEFALLEWYESNLSFENFMQQTEDFLQYSANFMETHLDHCGIDSSFCKKKISLHRLTVSDAFHEFVGISLEDGDPSLAAKAVDKGILSVRPGDDFETAFFKILLECVEPNIARIGPTILYDYPPSQAALSLVRHGVAKRCEVYIGRIEISNGFEELADPEENKARYFASMEQRRSLGFEIPDLDPHFIDALGKQFPPSCGQALGLDRWLAIICNLPQVGPLIPFRDHFEP